MSTPSKNNRESTQKPEPEVECGKRTPEQDAVLFNTYGFRFPTQKSELYRRLAKLQIALTFAALRQQFVRRTK